MAYRSRRPPKTTLRSRRPRRRMLRRKIYRNRRVRRQNVHLFKRSFATTISILKSANTAGCNFFSLNQLPNYGEFTALFDQYKVNGVKYEFIPRFNSIDQATATGGEFYTVIDRCDNDAPTSLNQMLEYQSMRKTPLTRKHTRYFKPGVPTGVYANVDDPLNAYPLASRVTLSPWLSTTDGENASQVPSSIEHLGLKYWCSATNASANTTVDVVCTAYLAMRTVR
ncbi:capsid protein [Circovirus sp.]|nr:capsid protein [Circovirus sp.]